MRGGDQADIVGPEYMAGQFPQTGNDSRDAGGRSWRAGIFRVADDPNNSILSDGAGGPGNLSMILKPAMCRLVPDMGRIDQGDQNIDVEQKRQGNSSRRALTISGVTTA